MKKRTAMWLGVLLTALLFISTVMTGCARSPEGAAPAPNAYANPVAASSVAPAAPGSAPGAPQEGIKVHGHWTIEVRNPDGTMVERREFDNALAPGGSGSFAAILARNKSLGAWAICLLGTAWPGTVPQGWLVEPSFPNPEPHIFATLVVDAPTSGANANKLVLSGTATALQDGNISQVQTRIELLSPSNPPSSTYGGDGGWITYTSLANPVNLSAGQQVMVTVVISFS